MNRARMLASMLVLSLLSGLLGCDVAVVAVLAARGKSKSSSSFAPTPDVTFRLWVAELGAAAGSIQEGIIRANFGDPDPGTWTQIPVGTTSGEFTMPPPSGTGFNAILIQATDVQVYEIDSFEIIDATGTTTETGAPATTFCSLNLTGNLAKAQGPPDGIGLATAASSTDRSFVFFKRTASITTFRINLWRQGAARISGDVEWAFTHVKTGDQMVGGADVNSAGMTYLTARDVNSTTWLMARVNSVGILVHDTPDDFDLTPIDTYTTTQGSASLAIDKKKNIDDVFVATTRAAGDIRLQKFLGTKHTNEWLAPALQGAGVDRIEANGLALNSDGELIVAGGIDGGLSGINHFLKKFSKINGADMWVAANPQPPAAPADTGNTYWYAAATDGTQEIFSTGDLTPPLSSPDAYTSKLIDTNTDLSNGGVTEDWNGHTQGGGVAPTRGQAVRVDGSHHAYVAGFTTSSGTSGLDSFVVKYDTTTGGSGPHFTPTRPGNDEILSISVEPDGTLYATGYETTSAQQDLVLFKLAPNGGVDWKRTLNFNNNADRGVQVMLTATHVIVVGQVTNTGGDLDIHVRKYVK